MRIAHPQQSATSQLVRSLGTSLFIDAQFSAFSEFDLIQIAQDLDRRETILWAQDANGSDNPALLRLIAGESPNYSKGGNFSIEV